MRNYKIIGTFCGIDHEVKFACEPEKLRELQALFALVSAGVMVNIVDDVPTECSSERGHFTKPGSGTCYCGALNMAENGEVTLQKRGREFI